MGHNITPLSGIVTDQSEVLAHNFTHSCIKTQIRSTL